MLVYGIVGTQVYLNVTDYFKNNTVANKYQMITDTQAGSFLGWLYLTASNLTTNDPVYSGSIYKINGTKSVNIAGTRTVTVLNVTGIALLAYWDKTIGIMVKLSFWFFYWSNYTMISFTSPGGPSAAPAGLSLSTLAALGEGVVIVLLLVYIVMSRRGHKGRK